MLRQLSNPLCDSLKGKPCLISTLDLGYRRVEQIAQFVGFNAESMTNFIQAVVDCEKSVPTFFKNCDACHL
jgi:hypothetical protein